MLHSIDGYGVNNIYLLYVQICYTIDIVAYFDYSTKIYLHDYS